MRRFILLFTVILSINLSAQDNHFSVENNSLIWSKVYQSKDSLLLENYQKHIKINDFTNPLTFLNKGFTGRTNQHHLRLKGPYWLQHPFDSFVVIEFKDNRYKVTVKEITFRGPTINIYGVEQKLDYNLNDNALSSGKLKTNKKILKAINDLDIFFTNTFKTSSINKEDW